MSIEKAKELKEKAIVEINSIGIEEKDAAFLMSKINSTIQNFKDRRDNEELFETNLYIFNDILSNINSQLYSPERLLIGFKKSLIEFYKAIPFLEEYREIEDFDYVELFEFRHDTYLGWDNTDAPGEPYCSGKNKDKLIQGFEILVKHINKYVDEEDFLAIIPENEAITLEYHREIFEWTTTML